MIIVKDSRNCLFNAAKPVTDTAWLKLHEKDGRQWRPAPLRFPLSLLPSPRFYSAFTGSTHRFRCDGGHKIEPNGRGLADKMEGEERKIERGTAREIGLLICKEDKHQRG